MILRFLIVTFVLLAFGGPVEAQSTAVLDPILIATGGPTGTYSAFFNQTARFCSNPPMNEMPSTGSIENIQNLLSNKVNVGFTQTDALYKRRLIDNDIEADNLRTLLVLYPEEVHIITKLPQINGFTDLTNKKVRAWGGSLVTGTVLFWKTNVRPLQFYDTQNQGNAMAQLDKGEADAIIAVGGQPLGWVEKLQHPYKVVPFNLPVDQNVMSAGYQPASLLYPNLANRGVPTVATPSLLVTMNYKSQAKVQALSLLRQCIVQHLDDLRETTGNHPKWRLVHPDNKTSWPMYEAALTFKEPSKAVPTPTPTRNKK